ncbi:MAG: CBASS oligonucleotide cyclase [Halodesulfurarchaeum sp.]|nr:CBASS oligonucleotide cyclase [Halodesulfurarchaeum sp.]
MGNAPTKYGMSGGYGDDVIATGDRRPDQSQLQDHDGQRAKAEREVDEAHEDYADEAEVTDRQKKNMQERRENVVGNLKDGGLEIEEDHIFGSVMQGTVTRPLDEDSDVDVLVVLDSDEHGEWAEEEDGPRKALNAVRRRLDKKYSQQDVYVDRNVVVVQFSDFKVEVAPAYRYSDVRDPDPPSRRAMFGLTSEDPREGYAIPDTYGGESWVGTNPRKAQAIYEAVNQSNNGKLQKVAVSAKKWNEENGKPVDSYHMVMMAQRYFQEDAPDNASTEKHMSRFMRKLPHYVNQETREPVYDERVDEGMSRGERRKASKEAYEASQKIREAERLKEQGKTEEAKEKYREVYGESFS